MLQGKNIPSYVVEDSVHYRGVVYTARFSPARYDPRVSVRRAQVFAEPGPFAPVGYLEVSGAGRGAIPPGCGNPGHGVYSIAVYAPCESLICTVRTYSEALEALRARQEGRR